MSNWFFLITLASLSVGALIIYAIYILPVRAMMKETEVERLRLEVKLKDMKRR